MAALRGYGGLWEDLCMSSVERAEEVVQNIDSGVEGWSMLAGTWEVAGEFASSLTRALN